MGCLLASENITVAVNTITPVKDCKAIIVMTCWGYNLQNTAYVSVSNTFLENGGSVATFPYGVSSDGDISQGVNYKLVNYTLKAGKTYTSKITTSGWGVNSGSYGGGVNYIVYFE